MNIKYSKILSIGFQHPYFQDQKMKDYSIEPSNESMRIFQKYNFRFVRDKQADSLYYNEAPNKSIAEELSNKPITLFFVFKSNDFNFLSYTNIPMQTDSVSDELRVKGNRTFFFSNQSASQEEGPKKIHEDEFVNVNQKRTLTALVFDVVYKGKTSTSKTFEIKNEEEEIIYTNTINGKDGEAVSHLVDLTGLAKTGDYFALFANDEKLEEGLIVENPEYYNAALGLIAIHLGNFKNRDYLILKKEGEMVMGHEEYTIHFDSRKTFWRYNLIAKNTEITNLKMTKNIRGEENLNNENIDFIKEKRLLPNNQEAITMTTKETYPIEENPSFFFSMEMDDSDSRQIKIKLPVAEASNIKKLNPSEKTEEYLSDIYVYI